MPQTTTPAPSTLSSAIAENRAALLGSASIEVTPRDSDIAPQLADHLPAGTRVHVTHLPTTDYRRVVMTSEALSRQGFVPVPHVAARSIPDHRALDNLLGALTTDAGVRSILLVAGDQPKPAGPFPDSLSILKTEIVSSRGIRSVAFSGHPEGHPSAQPEVMIDALARKVAMAEAQNLLVSVITQLCFEATPVLDWLRRIRGRGIIAPVRVGVAAPAYPATLMRFALRCGVGPSMRALTRQGSRLGRLLMETGPEEIIEDIATALNSEEAEHFVPIMGMHFFIFGKSATAASWLAAQQSMNRADS